MITQIFISGIILVLSVALLAIALIAARLVTKRRQVLGGFQNLDVQLRRRHEVVHDLAQLAKDKPDVPQECLKNVALLNSRAAAVRSPAEREHFEKALTASLKDFLCETNALPGCGDCPEFSQLSASLAEIERDLDRSTRYYNDAAKRFNQAVDSSPARFIAPIFSLQPQPFFHVHPPQKDLKAKWAARSADANEAKNKSPVNTSDR